MSCIVDSLSNLVNSHIVEDEAWVCSCTFSTKSLMTFNLNCVSHYPFPSLIHSNGVSPFPKSFCFTYWYPLLISFLAPLSVKTNSMIASFNKITQTRTKTFHKNICCKCTVFVLSAYISKETYGETDHFHWTFIQKQPLRMVLSVIYYAPLLEIVESCIFKSFFLVKIQPNLRTNLLTIIYNMNFSWILTKVVEQLAVPVYLFYCSKVR